MITAGVDLSSQSAKTAMCVIEWSDQRGEVVELQLGVDDDAISALVASVDKFGIDVPLGWPIAFAEAIAQYSADESWPKGYEHAANINYRYRKTDLWVWRELKTSPPLSVSADRISIPAMRAAALLSNLPEPLVRDNSGVVVEVYPAAALHRWDLPSRLYKRKENLDKRCDLVTRFIEGAPWLSIARSDEDLCIASDDAFDALVAASVARATAISLVDDIPPEDSTSALREGWIAVPLVGSLSRLADG